MPFEQREQAQKGIKTISTESGYLVIRNLYTDSSIVSDSIRIEGIMYDEMTGDTSKHGYELRFMNDHRAVVMPMANGRNSRYSYVVSAVPLWITFGMWFSRCERSDCPRIDSLVLPPKTVLVVDAYIRYSKL